MNIGELKHWIRQNVIPKDDSNVLSNFLPKLSYLDRNMLMQTICKYDAIECFKLAYHNFYDVKDLAKYAPLKILLHLKNDKMVFHAMYQFHLGNTKLKDYFCKVPFPMDFSDALNFYVERNYQVVAHLLPNCDSEITIFQATAVYDSCRDLTTLKPWTDKYEKIWSLLDRDEQIKVDFSRVKKEDWDEIVAFPFYGFDILTSFMLLELLQLTYPDNYYLVHKPGIALKLIDRVLQSMRRIRLGKL